MRAALILLALGLPGCTGPRVAYYEPPDPPAATTGPAGTAAATSSGTSGGTLATGSSGEPDNTTGSVFVPRPTDVPWDACDPWARDCPDGQKCTGFAPDGGGAVDTYGCVDIAADPAGIGEACTRESLISGLDSCEDGTICWDVDPVSQLGMCVELCFGSESEPKCSLEGEACAVGKSLALCLRDCDPTLADCPAGCGCYPQSLSDDFEFQCFADASGDGGAPGDPCGGFVNACDPGAFCASADAVPGCADDAGCCAAFCDLDDGTNCSGGTSCVSWYEAGSAPPGFAHVGACVEVGS